MAEVNAPGLSQAQVDQRIAAAIAALPSGGVSQATVEGLISTAVAPLATAASVPLPATGMPPGVADNGAKGSTMRYALEDHTHASKARKARVAVSGSTYTWTYPVAFGSGVVPICNGIAQVAAGNTDLFNVQVIGTPTNTQCTFQINRVSSGLLSLLLGALSINPTPASITLHLSALEP